jgi:hypothetical protein
MGIPEPRLESKQPAARPVIEGEVQVLVDHSAWTVRDCVSIFIWSGETTLKDALAARWRARLNPTRFLRGARNRLIQTEVWYAGKILICANIPEDGGVSRFIFSHSGGRQDLAAFSVRHSMAQNGNHSPIVRVVIVLRQRSETEMELVARSMLPAPENYLTAYPSTGELLALRRALTK